MIAKSPEPICWAACLSGCSQDFSEEHLLTASTLRGPELGVRGLPFLNGQTIRIHKDHFKSNILCRSHNNALSPVDEAGGTAAFELLRRAENGERGLTLNGPLLERWFLKTLINLEVAANFDVRPTSDMVEIAFGLRHFQKSAGLFYLGHAEPLSDGQIETDERVSYTQLLSAPNQAAGGRFEFCCFKFLLMITNLEEADQMQWHAKKLAVRSSNLVHVNW
jgi:hypothetical protein